MSDIQLKIVQNRITTEVNTLVSGTVNVSSGVTSFNTRQGAVTSQASDYDASQIDNDSTVSGATVADALNTNKGLIGTNTTNITTNSGNISTNTANISTNATNIATNTTDIAGKLDDVTAGTGIDIDKTSPNDPIINNNGVLGVTNDAGITVDNSDVQNPVVRLGPHYLALASSSVYEGFTLSIGATQGTFNIADGEGLYIDNSVGVENITPVKVVFNQTLNIPLTNIATQIVTYICIDQNAQVIQLSEFPTPIQRRDYIFIGVVVHSDNVNVNAVNNEQVLATDVIAQLNDLMNGIGVFNLDGNIITANGANLSINKSIGDIFKAGVNYINNAKNPHELELPALTAPATMRYRLSDGTEYANTAFIDPDNYESPLGTLAALGNNKYSIQKIAIFPSNLIRIQYGQTEYNSRSEAIDAVGKENFVFQDNIKENGLVLASLVVKKGETDLSAGDAVFFQTNKFGESGSAGSSGTTDLQNAYDNSLQPQILLDAVLGPLQLQQAVGQNANSAFEVLNDAGTQTFDVTGSGKVTATDFNGVPLTTGGSSATYLDGTGNYTTPAGGGGSPLTTKGDLFTYGTGDTRLGVGTDGQLLVPDSTESTGLKYTNPTSVETAISFIFSTNAQGASNPLKLGKTSTTKATVDTNSDDLGSSENDPYIANYQINDIEYDIECPSFAVSQGTVGTAPKMRFEIYTWNSAGTDASVLTTFDIPMDETKCNVFNNLGTTDKDSQSGKITLGTPIPANEPFGIRWLNVSTNNTWVNSAKNILLLIVGEN